MLLQVIGRNKETQEEEVFELPLPNSDVACIYKDKYGVAVSTRQGKVYRVIQKMTELEEQLMS
jgi:hypothetical protein